MMNKSMGYFVQPVLGSLLQRRRKNQNNTLKSRNGVVNYNILVSVKQKEKVSANSVDDDIYCYPVMKSRQQEIEDRRRQRDFASLDDIMPILDKYGGPSAVKNSVEHQPAGDTATTTSAELKKQREYTNRKTGNSYYVH
jgi:hypothetical protein